MQERELLQSEEVVAEWRSWTKTSPRRNPAANRSSEKVAAVVVAAAVVSPLGTEIENS